MPSFFRIYIDEKDYISVPIEATTTAANLKEVILTKRKVTKANQQLHIISKGDKNEIRHLNPEDLVLPAVTEAGGPEARIVFGNELLPKFSSKARRQSLMMCIPQLKDVDETILSRLSKDFRVDRQRNSLKDKDRAKDKDDSLARTAELPEGFLEEGENKEVKNHWTTHVLQDVLCLLCQKILVAPVVSSCGHSVCKACSTTVTNCPECCKPISSMEMFPCHDLNDILKRLQTSKESSWAQGDDYELKDDSVAVQQEGAAKSRLQAQNSIAAKAALALESVFNEINKKADQGAFLVYLSQDQLYPEISEKKQKEKKHDVYSKVHSIVTKRLKEMHYVFENVDHNPETNKKFSTFDPKNIRYLVKWGNA
mmetsp:Transcript_138/g.275  ORF Transcript_138/g.275 Transcript_138/m.275 type:complete len:368 (+) Transcript_138:54-1157(+)